jgi:glycosyltransferase involved in cell wall biosynthesis
LPRPNRKIFADSHLDFLLTGVKFFSMTLQEQCAAVIPCLNEEAAIASLVRAVRGHLPAVLVVDDGSHDRTATLAEQAGALVLSHARTRGKGAALQTGCREALKRGFSWALLMDGDGQHSPDDIRALFECAHRTSAQLVAGNRMTDPARMPLVRRWVNRWMSARLSRAAGRYLPDSQCGFRLMSLKAWSALPLRTTHFEVESEVLLGFVAAGHAVEFVPVQTIYKDEQSKIHPLRDTLRWFRWWRGQASGKVLEEPASLPGEVRAPSSRLARRLPSAWSNPVPPAR